MSMRMLSDVPANTPPTTKMTNPPMYTRLRPTMSDRRPIGSSRALMASAYPISTHWVVGRSVPKCSAMVGIVTFRLPKSATDVNVPMASARNTHHL